jgi:hypothetical protein
MKRNREVRLDRLVGRRLLTANNQVVGRIEEFRGELRGASCRISGYVIGAAGVLERLGLGVTLLFGRRTGGYLARWDQVDVSDPDRPRLTCSVEALRRL